jgi:hypothetical protein
MKKSEKVDLVIRVVLERVGLVLRSLRMNECYNLRCVGSGFQVEISGRDAEGQRRRVNGD